MINTIIFDLDGLLVDTETTWYQVWNDILKIHKKSFTLQDYVTNYSGKTVVDNINLLIKNFNLPITTEEGVSLANQIERTYIEQGVRLKPGAENLLEYLRENEYKIVLGTSSTKERAIIILKNNHVLEYFHELVVGYEVKRGKPFPDIFLEAAARVHSNPENCLVLEDSEMGIQASYAADIPVICIPDLKQPSKEYAEKTVAILPTLENVISYLKQHNVI